MNNSAHLLYSTALVLLAGTGHAQQASAPTAARPGQAASGPDVGAPASTPAANDQGSEEEDIVVTGQRPRGSVVGDIPPENTLTARDVRATGATSITELLAAIAPQTGSARGRGGGGPVLLLNGQRISGFQEVRDLPPEAIERLEILPEEVALKYGYAADQRVVNIVLRQRFRSTTTRADAGVATAGGYANGVAEASRLLIGTKGRTNLTVHAEGNSALTESERDIALQQGATGAQGFDPRDFRTLRGSQRIIRATGNFNRTVLGDASATLTTEVSHTQGRSLFGVPSAVITIPANSPFAAEGTSATQSFPAFGPLTRNSSTDAAHLGLSVNGQKQRWRYSVTGNADLSNSITRSDGNPDLTAVQAAVTAGNPAVDPAATLNGITQFGRDRARSTTKSAGLDGTLNGPLIELPAGRANVTLKAGVDTLHLDGYATRQGIGTPTNLARDHATASANVDVPLARRNGALGHYIGQLTLNGNVEIEHYSDFGTVTTIGGGANWSPAVGLNLITSYTREEGVPSINNLGDPVLVTPAVRVFDYRRGTTVLASVTTGGNPALLADRRDVWKLGANWQPWQKTDLRFRADFVSSRLTNPVETFPGPSAALEAAFPGRFTRDATGTLTAVDFTPVNYDSARSDVLRIGFDFSKPLKSAAPPQTLIDQFRRFRGQQAGGAPAGRGGAASPNAGGSPPGGDRPGGGFGGGSGFGGRGGGGFFGGGNQRGRLTFSLTDTVALVDRAVIRPGLPTLDFLNGAATSGGQGGGRSRHTVEAQAGYYNNGLGARLSANYATGTRVTGSQAGDLDFSPLATFDLNLFANLGDNLAFLAKHRWARGTSVRFQVSNIFDARQRVQDATGAVPFNYQGALLNPVGRTIGISIRKLFIPSRFFQRPRAAG